MNIPLTLNRNSEVIVANIEQESIDAYLFLKEQFEETDDIRENHLFHFVFRSFYRLDNAGLSDEMKVEYFNLLQETRDRGTFDFQLVCDRLYQLVNLKGQNTLQFSFVTKMANIINDSRPIYDSEVASMFDFRTPYNYRSYSQRLTEYCNFYVEISDRYIEFTQDNLILEVFDILGGHLQNIENISDSKKLDFLMWSAGKLKRRNILTIT